MSIPVSLRFRKNKGKWLLEEFRPEEGNVWYSLNPDMRDVLLHSKYVDEETDLQDAVNQKTISVMMDHESLVLYDGENEDPSTWLHLYERGVSETMLKESPLPEEARVKYQKRMKMYFDKRHPSKIPQLQEGDHILVQAGYIGKKPVVNGPYRVKRIRSFDGYPKTVVYEDEKKKDQIAAIKNVLQYHCRDNTGDTYVDTNL